MDDVKVNGSGILPFEKKSEKDWLRGVLRMHDVSITFMKKDGTERKMLCTLKEDKIPSEQKPKNTGKKQPDDSVAVFDIEKKEWRSFRFDSVREIHFSIE